MTTSKRYSPEIRERAVRMVLEHEEESTSQCAAIESIAQRFGCTSETLRRLVRRAERDPGRREELTTDERERVKVYRFLAAVHHPPPVAGPRAPCGHELGPGLVDDCPIFANHQHAPWVRGMERVTLTPCNIPHGRKLAGALALALDARSMHPSGVEERQGPGVGHWCNGEFCGFTHLRIPLGTGRRTVRETGR